VENDNEVFYKNFIEACNNAHVSPVMACRECGISTSAPTAWKNGAIPRAKTVRRLEEYFKMEPNSLWKETKEKTPLSDENDAGNDEFFERFKRAVLALPRSEAETMLRLAESRVEIVRLLKDHQDPSDK
jgi:hypothetical protein